jgi:hypothetical protein
MSAQKRSLQQLFYPSGKIEINRFHLVFQSTYNRLCGIAPGFGALLTVEPGR